MDKYKKQREKAISEMLKLSPAQRDGIQSMLRGECDHCPSDFVKKMNFGGEYTIDHDLKMVEMNGDFSKSDLLKIAAVMID